jgi:hypothetical protein
VRALLASPLGFVVGWLLGALGGGGSILAVPVLVYVAGQDVRAATASSLALVAMSSALGAVAHHRAGRVVLGTGVAFGLTGVLGSLSGSALNRRLDPDVLLLGFAVLVTIAAWRMVVGCPTCTRVGERRALLRRPEDGRVTTRVRLRLDTGEVIKIVAAGTGVGFVTGLFGVGGGFVIVPALTLILQLSMPDAIGTSLVVIVINSIVALGARVGSSSIEWAVAIPFAVAAAAGVLSGTAAADRLDAARSLRWFARLLVVVAVYTAARAIAGLT